MEVRSTQILKPVSVHSIVEKLYSFADAAHCQNAEPVKSLFQRLVESHLAGVRARSAFPIGRDVFALAFNWNRDPETYEFSICAGIDNRFTYKDHYRHVFGIDSPLPERMFVSVGSHFLLSQHVLLVEQSDGNKALAAARTDSLWPTIRLLWIAVLLAQPCEEAVVSSCSMTILSKGIDTVHAIIRYL